MDLDKNSIDDLIRSWLDFKEEELSTMSIEDRKHPLHFDTYSQKILKNVPNKNKKYISNVLDDLYDDFVDYITYYNEKYYKIGFGDCLKLTIGCLGTK